MAKTGKWSLREVNRMPEEIGTEILLVKILSINVALFKLILVGSEIRG